jgi:hypothetical protein
MFTATQATSTIGELQSGLSEALEAIRAGVPLASGLENLKCLAPPRGTTPRVSFHYSENHRKVREDASANYWSDGVYVRIEFVPNQESNRPQPEAEDFVKPTALPRSVGRNLGTDVEARISELVLILDQAERDPLFRHFVALTAFRDKYLPNRASAWATSLEARHDVLRQAIDQRWVLKTTVHNPKTPQYPVAAIRVNRGMPEVDRILEANRQTTPFSPVRFMGQPLSHTVIHDRR